jgi:hypothetical protein
MTNAYSTNGEKRNVYKFWQEILKEILHFEALAGRIILERILKKNRMVNCGLLSFGSDRDQ